MTSNVNNTGIAHASFTVGGAPLCKSRRAHFCLPVDKFRNDTKKCKRCAAKLAKSDAVKAKRNVP